MKFHLQTSNFQLPIIILYKNPVTEMGKKNLQKVAYSSLLHLNYVTGIRIWQRQFKNAVFIVHCFESVWNFGVSDGWDLTSLILVFYIGQMLKNLQTAKEVNCKLAEWMLMLLCINLFCRCPSSAYAGLVVHEQWLPS